MKPIATLREQIASVPALARRRSAAATARSRVVSDARAVAPEIPRDADAGHLLRAARRLMRRAAQDEFAREGIEQVRLPEDSGRTALRRADVPGEASFQAFVEDVLSAVVIAPSTLERDDAADLRRARSSSDAYGLSPEVAADLASFLLGRAYALDALDAPEEIEALEQSAGDLERFLEQQAEIIREDVRTTLVRQVRVPLELRAARERHARIGRGESPEPEGASPQGGPTDRDATEADRAGFSQRAQAAFDFAQSEAGRAAFSVLRSGAGKAYGKYGHREGEGRSGGSGSSAPRTPPPS
ncbi:hypothetical protein [Brachybacterium sp. YJGR34]|uniref:hypothetical protein n=1 Tax=Brachybacterium sp. YJGR34 TaxID=2059911 RepID=UPI0018E5AC24|nr:hypothetical protein [Brachybacterium sp. YJGR34]